MTFWFPQYEVMTQTAMVSGPWDTRYPIKRCFWTCLGGGFHGRLAFADCPPDAASRGQSKQGETGRLCSAWLRARPGCPVLPGPRPLGPDRRLHPGLSLPGLRTPPPALLASRSWTAALGPPQSPESQELTLYWLRIGSRTWFDLKTWPTLLPLVKGALRPEPIYRPRAPGMQGGLGSLEEGPWHMAEKSYCPSFSQPSPKGPVAFYQGNCTRGKGNNQGLLDIG